LAQKILRTLLDGGEKYGRQICVELDVNSGSFHPAVTYLLEVGLVTVRREKRTNKGTPAVFYSITPEGRQVAIGSVLDMPPVAGADNGDAARLSEILADRVRPSSPGYVEISVEALERLMRKAGVMQ
jgi:DNA-binding transcriptional ArsR family regulator